MDRLGFKQCGIEGESRYWFEILINEKSLEEFIRPAFIALDIDHPETFLSDCSLIPYDMFYRCACEEQSVVDDFLIRTKKNAWFVTAFDQAIFEQCDSLHLILSICGCGEWGCGWTSALMRATERTIHWSRFNYSGKYDLDLPDLTFDRSQYLEAIEQVYRTMGSIPLPMMG